MNYGSFLNNFSNHYSDFFDMSLIPKYKTKRYYRENPKFIKCKSCGFEVMEKYVIDGICEDCRNEEDEK